MSNKFTAYDLVTGRVLYSGTAANVLQLQSDSVGTLLGVTLSGGWLDSKGMHHAQPQKPSQNHIFDWTEKQWKDPRTIDDMRAAKWVEIKQVRSAAEYGGFTWDGSTFDSDAISQTRIQGAVQLAGMSSEFSIDWTLADNSVRTLSAADMLAVGAALVAHVGVQFERARALRVQIEAAESPEALAALGW